MPVTAPARRPAPTARTVATTGFTPFMISMAHVQPPSAKLPSTVRSAISRSLYVIYTPRAIIPQSIPCPVAPRRDVKRLLII